MPLLFGAPIRIQPYFGYRNRERLVVSARALRSALPEFRNGGRLQAMRTMLAQFASREAPHVPLELEIVSPDGIRERHEGRTDGEGFVHFDIRLEPQWPLGEHTRWEVVAFHWANREGAQTVEGHVLAPGADAGLGVISDIDDTIVETGITGGMRQILRNWRRVVAQLPDERLLVPGADVFYNALGGGVVLREGAAHAGERLGAAHRPFFYVSSSPWNLFSYLVAFQKSRNLPLGPLILRDWGFDSETLGSASHGAHKIAAIARILETYPDLSFALIGDDTQADLIAFARAVADHPGQVRAVLIRRAGEPFSPEELLAKGTIETAGVPLWLGDSYATGQEFLRAIGLDHDGEAEKIVETVEKPDKAATAEARA